MVERRLATVMVADVAGYSRLMAEDDEATLARLARHREVIEASLARHGGRPFGAVADSLLAEFASPVEAVRCSVDLQHALHQLEAGRPEGWRMRWRIGLNLGDVMANGDELVGDGVNVAARLEAVARPGGICLAASVIEHVRSHLVLSFESLGRLQLKNIARPVDAFRIPLPSDRESTAPYSGLLPLDEATAAMFHGRARAVAEVCERLLAQAAAGRAFLLVWGASGVGKSSLVRAGLVPALTGPASSEGGARWLVAVMRLAVGEAPLTILADALARATPGGNDGVESRLAAAVACLGQGVADGAEMVRGALGEGAARVLLVVDQLEALLVDPAHDRDAKAAFVRSLRALAEHGGFWIAATMRGDFYHRCAEVPGLAELRDGLASYELLPPSPAEIGVIIREPVARVGLEFERTADEGRLDDVLHDDAVVSAVPLPLLSFTMAALCAAAVNRTLTFAEYRALGGFHGAIARRAEDVVARLAPPVLGALPGLLRLLVTLGADGTVTGRAVGGEQLAVSPERLALAEELIDARLLVSGHSAAGSDVRLAHEALLTHWPRAADLLRADRALLELRAALEADRARWAAGGRRPDLLLPPGPRLAAAEEVASLQAADLGAELLAYVASSARARDTAASRSLRRARALAVTFALLALTAVAFAGLANRARNEAEAARVEMATLRAEAEAAREIAERERDRAAAATSRLLARRAQEAITDGRPDVALALALRAMPRALEDPARGPDTALARQALLEALHARRRLAELSSGGMGVTGAEFSPDGRSIVTATNDGRARIWRADDETVALVTRKAGEPLTAVGYSPDGARIAGGFGDGALRIWDAASGAELVQVRGHAKRVMSLSWAATGEQLLSSSADGTARLWDARDLGLRLTLRADDETMWAAALDPTGPRIATASEDGTLRVWSTVDGTVIHEVAAHAKRVWSLAYAPHGNVLATGSHDRTVRLWRADTLVPIGELAGHQDWVTSVAFSHDGRRLATGSADQSVAVWDVATGAMLARLTGHRHRVWSARFNADDTRLISASEDGTAQLWDLAGLLPGTVVDAGGVVTAVVVAGAQGAVVAATTQGIVTVWDQATAAPRGRLSGPGPPIAALAADRQGHLLVAPAEGPLQIWRLSDLELERTVDLDDRPVAAAAIASRGDRIAVALADGRVQVVSLDDGGIATLPAVPEVAMRSLAITPDGRQLVGVGSDGAAWHWNVDGGAEPQALVDATAALRTVAIAADGRRAVLAGHGAVHIVDLLGDDGPLVIDIGDTVIESVSFGGDSNRFATAARDGTCQIWDARTGGGLGLVRGYGAAGLGVALSEDATALVAGFSDGTVRLWSTPTWSTFAEVLEHARAVLPDELALQARDNPMLDD